MTPIEQAAKDLRRIAECCAEWAYDDTTQEEHAALCRASRRADEAAYLVETAVKTILTREDPGARLARAAR